MSVTYVEEPNALKHNVLFGIVDGIYYHYVSALYTLNREERADFAEEGARPFVESQLHDVGINELLIADMATRLGVDKEKVNLDNVLFDVVERDEDQLAAAIKEFVEHKRLYSEGGKDEVYLFGSYFLTTSTTNVGKSVAHFLGTPIHFVEASARAAEDRTKGDLVIVTKFSRQHFGLENPAVVSEVRDFIAASASRI